MAKSRSAVGVKHISESFIKPELPDEAKKLCALTPWDLAMLSVNYIQKGLLFAKPPAMAEDQESFINALLHRLKDSLSLTLLHFYPLSGRLATLKGEDPPSYTVFIDCRNSPGAKFIFAAADLTVSDLLSPADVPGIVQSFFDHDRAVNHDGHADSLLTVQVTDLVDGIFVGCSMNHVAGDGTSFWNFFNTWSEIFQTRGSKISISRPPVHDRWFPDGHGRVLNLPFAHPDEFISRHEAPELRERFFHFSSDSITGLKARANSESGSARISSFQALSALVWRSITRARGLPPGQKTSCRLAANNRPRLNPPLPENLFGNYIYALPGTATAGELLEESLARAALRIHEAVLSHDDGAIRRWLDEWIRSPFVFQLGRFFDPNCVMMGSSPRFNKYGVDFGLGKALALRSGYANKFDGKVTAYPGREGGGSVDLEICLRPDWMRALESDKEFMDAAYSR